MRNSPQHNPEDPLDMLWSCAAIALELNRTERQTFHMLESGQLPPAKKIGAKWCVDRQALRAFFRESAA